MDSSVIVRSHGQRSLVAIDNLAMVLDQQHEHPSSLLNRKAFRILQKGSLDASSTWKEVDDTFGDLKAEGDLKDAPLASAQRIF